MHQRCALHASTSSRCQAIPTVRHRHHQHSRAHRSQLQVSSNIAQKAQQFAETAKRRVSDYVREQKLERKAATASKEAQQKLTSAFEEAQQNMRRTYMKLDAEYNIQANADNAAKKVEEAVKDLDQQWSLRRRLRAAGDDLKRKLPIWRKQLAQFSSKTEGKVVWTVLLVVFISTGALWQVLNLLWLLWWLSVPVSMYLADQARKNQQAQQQRQQQQQAQGGLGSFFNWGNTGNTNGSSTAAGWSASKRRYEQDGPVLDAEWVSIDEGDSSRR
eukprot:jgi/Chrzof1/12720/Cz07g05050.t1